MDIINWYIENRPTYKKLALKVESLLVEVFEVEKISYHIITSRAKDIDSVKKKASKNKYDKPHEEIQDFAGIRIITYVEDEVEKVCNIIEKTFNIDKENSENKSDDLGIDKVGYKSVHYIASLDESRLELLEYKQYIKKCFEIQVRTILQHAWAEIEHDRNYKFTGKLPTNIGRRFKILAGVLEMADREFNTIANEIDLISKDTIKNTKKGKLNILISSTTLTQYLHTRFINLINKGFTITPNTDEEIFDEIEKFGLTTLKEFDKIISKKIEPALIELGSKVDNIYEIGLVRRILIVNNYDKYFSEVIGDRLDNWSWANEEHHEIETEFFKQCGIDWSLIEEEYNLSIS